MLVPQSLCCTAQRRLSKSTIAFQSGKLVNATTYLKFVFIALFLINLNPRKNLILEKNVMSDREEIQKVFERVYVDNVRQKKVDDYGKMYTTDALWMAPDVPDRSGVDDIIEGFAQSVAHQDIEPIFTADEIEVMGDFGYVIGTSEANIYPDDGSPAKEVKFRALWLMKKVNGEWKIDRQIWNKKPR